MAKRTKEIALLGFLIALITVTGLFKLPGILPGTEFQLSAPVAVAIAAVFGIRRYLLAGVLSSLVGLAFGFQTIWNIAVAMTFRLAAGGLIAILGNTLPVLLLAGLVGTFCARWILALMTQTKFWILVLAAAPGMLYTAITAFPFAVLLTVIARRSGFREFLTPRRSLFRRILKKKKGVLPHAKIQSENARQPQRE